MGYRYTFYVVEKENLNNITHEEIEYGLQAVGY